MFKNPKFYMVRTLHFFVFCTDLRTDTEQCIYHTVNYILLDTIKIK